MRRHRLVVAATAAAVLLIAGCGSDSAGERRTVTAVVTVSSGASGSASVGASASGSATATAGTESGTASSGTASSAAGSSAGSSTAAPIKKVDPLKVECASILSAADVKTIFKQSIPNDRLKITVAELNKDAGQTGRVRCLYGLSGDKKSGAFAIALTQYTNAAAAERQVEVTVQNETDNNAKVSTTTVSGYPATVALRDGGLIVMPYDNWTLAIATSSDIDAATLQKGLPQVAEAVLTRILKS